MSKLKVKGQKAKEAAYKLAGLSTTIKNQVLCSVADALIHSTDSIIKANALDIKEGKEKGLTSALIDRLTLDEDRVKAMAEGLIETSQLPDPVGEVVSMWKRPNGIMIGQQRTPLGVIGIIYEARPNVTVDAFGLSLKSGNAVILRGGSEAINSNIAIVKVIKKAVEEQSLPEGTIQLIEDTDRAAAQEMMKLHEYIDVLIPRGGAGLIQTVIKNSTIPVIATGDGNCHVYVDGEADLKMAEDIVINAKTQRPGVCNTIETLLVNEAIAKEFLPNILDKLKEHNVEIRGCKKTKEIVPDIVEAEEEDWGKEYLDYIIAVKVVDGIDEAIWHINHYGTKHSESIVTTNYNNAQKFLQEVDAAAVYANASTRFTDGAEFGFGAEMGISTQKLHARGPLGLKELTTMKYIIYGTGQIR